MIESYEFVVVWKERSRHEAHLFWREVAYLIGHVGQEGVVESL